MGKSKLNIPMCAALILFCLTLISIHLTSGLFARYTTTATAGDSARVAKFDVTADVQQAIDNEGKPIEGQFILTVTNRSEVAVEYQMVVSLDDGMDMNIVNPADITEQNNETISDNKKTITNTQWKLAPNTGVRMHTLQFEIKNWVGLTKAENSGETEPVDFDFKVEVTAMQID